MDREERNRVVIEHVGPQIDCGRFPIKRAAGETVTVVAHAFSDGHDRIRVELLYRGAEQEKWSVRPMNYELNDEWFGSFTVTTLGRFLYSVRAWVDPFGTWQDDLRKKLEAGQQVALEFRIGSVLLRQTAQAAEPADAERLREWAQSLEEAATGAEEGKNVGREEGKKVGTPGAQRDLSPSYLPTFLPSSSPSLEAADLALSEELTALMRKYPDRSFATTYPAELAVLVDRPKAVFSTWYELFPRSWGRSGAHGTFRDCERLLPDIAAMGFDVLYLPPIHPIGRSYRKGRNGVPIAEVRDGGPNNSTTVTATDPGSPWAIGSAQGGHKAIDPQLGSSEDFQHLRAKAAEYGLEIALDLAFQCSPDHPYVREHPEWFRWRPDGTVQFAENPPKKYQDILPLNFESDHWRELWEELRSTVLFWIDQGVRIFRVDNPHTKPFRFWHWLIDAVRHEHPDVIFLSEAFTRPKVMLHLAKVGFNQSYTYFTWRNTKWELEQYIRELTQTEAAEYLRPSFWPNTPDILPQYLQYGGRPAFLIRLILAATLCASYGIYGPAFELGVTEALEGKEEYLNSEKYELKQWDWNARGNLRPVIERVNRIRRQNPSLQRTRNVELYPIDNEALLCYGKTTEDKSNITITVVSLDPHHRQSGWVRLPLEKLQIDRHSPFLAHDLLTGDRYLWQGETNYVELDPRIMPAHILHLQRRLRREMDFDYFM